MDVINANITSFVFIIKNPHVTRMDIRITLGYKLHFSVQRRKCQISEFGTSFRITSQHPTTISGGSNLHVPSAKTKCQHASHCLFVRIYNSGTRRHQINEMSVRSAASLTSCLPVTAQDEYIKPSLYQNLSFSFYRSHSQTLALMQTVKVNVLDLLYQNLEHLTLMLEIQRSIVLQFILYVYLVYTCTDAVNKGLEYPKILSVSKCLLRNSIYLFFAIILQIQL